ncbi:acetyltransferase [Cellulophaga baltica]|uniref:acetyltransferase n=1 Tax=Cellulophaga TaxID=104264 RepID=UPI001C06DF79|nr:MULTISPECIES: acetyltransferase [Cellulophaga]MBU2995980.1 acetyltransferase [Cellulophaga baltica]MDO6767375.1 acetyltransferase [Cellulophaga sp. 1_MG-2023]
MKSLYIVGAGGAAKEIFLLIKEINQLNPIYKFKGFIDVSTQDFLKIGDAKYPIINEIEFLNRNNNEIAIIFGLADINKLKKIVRLYKQNDNFEFPNLIHPSVQLDNSINMGIGNVITTQCVFTVDTCIGSFNYINRGTHIGHDCKIGSYNVINPCAVISGGVEIGDKNLIGTRATILQYLKIGSKNTIGASALLTKNLENNFCMIGVPAKQMVK